MGSCISKTSKKPHASSPPPPPHSSKHHHFQDRTLVPESDPPPSLPRKSTATPPKRRPQAPSPPPPIIEEETVKEVLSETPAAKPSIHRFQQNPKILRLPSFPKLEEHKNRSNEEISELSEICSVADSVSTSALTEQSRDYEEVLQQQPRMIDRSPSKIRRKRTESGESYSRGESPVRKPEQWLSPGQTSRQWSISQNQNGVVRDQGESSRRRSRSPVTRIDSGVSRPGVCRSPSGKRGGRSAGRSPVPASEIGRSLDDARDGKRPVKESLEDPLVSLECFIFL